MQDQYEAHLARMTADQYWDAVVETGWLSDVPSSEHAALEARVREAFTRDPVYAWSALAATAFDSECIYGTDPEGASYLAQLTLLAQATHGIFRPSSMQNEYVNSHIRVSFVHDGRTYVYDARADTDYFDPGVFALINRALEESGTSKRLIALPAADQVYHLVVVRAQTYRRAEQLKIIPPPAYFIHRRNRSAKEVDAYLDEYYSRLG